VRIRGLSIQGFRNLHPLTLQPAGWNLILGANAQGKTNLLEGLYLLGHGRSFRARYDREMVAIGQETALLRVVVEDQNQLDHDVRLQLSATHKKMWLDGRPVAKLSNLLGVLPIVYISSFGIELVHGAPVVRRRWLDRTIGQIDPYYLHVLIGCHRAAEQRNKLLREPGAQAAWFEAIESTLADFAEPLWARREKWVKRLAGRVLETFALFFPGVELSIELGGWGAANADGQRQEKYRGALKNGRQSDIISRFTRLGPHRDDLVLKLDQRDVRVFGSLGQQKALALSLDLAAARLMSEELGSPPVIALDDIYSELDQRFAALVRQMIPSGAQVFETGVLGEHPPVVPDGAECWRVVKGEVLPWRA